MTNKNQVGDTVWFYSYSHGKVMPCEINRVNVMRSWGKAVIIASKELPHGMAICPRDLYDTKDEAVASIELRAKTQIKVLQTILDNLKDDTDQHK